MYADQLPNQARIAWTPDDRAALSRRIQITRDKGCCFCDAPQVDRIQEGVT
jgi:hypothetical protein